MVGGLPANRTVNGFAVDPGNPRTIYVVMRDGIFKSVDAGSTWKPLGKDLKNLVAVAVNPKKPNEMYVVTAEGTVFRSTDAVTRWKRLY